MASTEHEPIMVVWGQCHQQGLGAEPLMGVQRAESFKLFIFYKRGAKG